MARKKSAANNPPGKKKAPGPRYDSGVRIARLIDGLRRRPRGWSYVDIEEDLGINRRTLQRYLRIARDEFDIETFRSGNRLHAKLASENPALSGTSWEIAALFFALRLARVLEGTAFADFNATLYEKVEDAIPRDYRRQLGNLDRKFYCLPFMPRVYDHKDEIIDTAMSAVVEQIRLSIAYEGSQSAARTHEVDAYSLVEHRGGLYILGKSRSEGKILFFAIERIRSAKRLRNADRSWVRFNYPAAFDPARFTEGLFGVYDGPRIPVVLALQNDLTRSFLEARRIHPTQKFVPGPDGRTHLHLEVRGKEELTNWILSTSPWVEVLEPASLREHVVSRLAESLAIYRPDGEAVKKPAPKASRGSRRARRD